MCELLLKVSASRVSAVIKEMLDSNYTCVHRAVLPFFCVRVGQKESVNNGNNNVERFIRC